MIEAELADGTILEFPEGTDTAVIDRVVKQHMSKSTSTPESPESPESPEQSMSSSELLEGMPTPQAGVEQSNWEYVKDRMAKRYGDWIDVLQKVGTSSARDPLVWNSMPPEVREAVETRLSSDKSGEYASALGYEGLQPTNQTQLWMGRVGEAAVDPLTLMPAIAPLKMAGVAGGTLLQTSKPYLMSLLEWSAGTGAEVAGTAAAEFTAEKFKGTEYEGSVIDHLARVGSSFIAGGTVGAASPFSLFSSGEAGVSTAKRGIEEGSEAASDVLSNGAVQAVLENAVKSEGASFNNKLRAVEDLQEQFPELVIPLIDAVGDNKILQTEFKRLYRASPEFQQKYNNTAANIKQQFDKYQQGVFPSRLAPGQQVRKPILDEVSKRAAQAVQKSNQKLNNIEQVRANLAQRYDDAPLSSNIEKAVDNLSKTAEKTARERASVYYDDAFTYAEANGLRLPAESVKQLWNYSSAQRKADLFADFPGLYRKIQNIWQPKKVEASPIVDMRGVSLRPGAQQRFSSASIEDVDSLKTELNAAINSTTDRTKQRALRDLKDELDRQLISLDPTFAQKYKLADTKYYEGVGLPTSLSGYRSVDSARFATTVAEALTKPEQIRDYLNFVGRDAGLDVVRDAMLMKARTKILNASGEVDPNKLKAFISRNKEALNEVPEIRSLFEKDALLAERLVRGKAKIDSTYNTFAKQQSEGFFKVVANKNIDAVATEVLSNPGKRRQYLDQIDTLSPDSKKLALTGLRQSVLEKAMESKGTTVLEYVQANKEAFDDLFGEGYSQSISNLATLRDLINANEKNVMDLTAISHRKETAYQKLTGLTEEETLGTIRTPIMSGPRKFFHLGSKAAKVKTNAKIDKALADLLLDTKGIKAVDEKAKQLLDAFEGKGNLGKASLDFFKAFSFRLGGYITTRGTQAAVGGAFMEDDLERETTMLPSYQEDDWLFAPN
jgi:hypothetical protein